MAVQRAIDMALDLSRMPAFAHSMSASPLPNGMLEVICIAAEAPDACRAASSATGMPEQDLVEAARFYLQQVLFRPGADCYRILGLRQGDTRESARLHMSWLLQWLHPDRNGGWDAVYAKQVVTAWREFSNGADASPNGPPARNPSRRRSQRRYPIRVPLIERPREKVLGHSGASSYPWMSAHARKLVAGLFTLFLLLGLTAAASGGDSTTGLFSALNDAW